jgi:hypothetical protein
MNIEHRVWGERDNIRVKKRNRAVYVAVVFVLLLMVYFGAKAVVWGRKAARQYEKNEALNEAIVKQDRREAEVLLRAGAGPNETGEGDSILNAMSHNDDAMVKLLMRYGANPSKSLLRTTDPDYARALLKLGANPNAPVGYEGQTVFMTMCIGGAADEAQLLLNNGANPKVRDNDGQTILQRMEYAAGNHPESAIQYGKIRTLLKKAGVVQ